MALQHSSFWNITTWRICNILEVGMIFPTPHSQDDYFIPPLNTHILHAMVWNTCWLCQASLKCFIYNAGRKSTCWADCPAGRPWLVIGIWMPIKLLSEVPVHNSEALVNSSAPLISFQAPLQLQCRPTNCYWNWRNFWYCCSFVFLLLQSFRSFNWQLALPKTSKIVQSNHKLPISVRGFQAIEWCYRCDCLNVRESIQDYFTEFANVSSNYIIEVTNSCHVRPTWPRHHQLSWCGSWNLLFIFLFIFLFLFFFHFLSLSVGCFLPCSWFHLAK